MASDEIKAKCLESFGGWIASLADDIGLLLEVVENDSLERPAREAAAGGINYLFKSLDLIPDGIDDIGYLDDAFTVRISSTFIAGDDVGALGDEKAKRIGQLAGDADLIKGLLGDDLYERFLSYVKSLRLGAARGRMVSEILDDPSNLQEFAAEVRQFCKDYQAPEFHEDEKNLIKLTAFFDAKLPRT
jgi:uncharacterized membrane protein YkvA (DUF1232 family)